MGPDYGVCINTMSIIFVTPTYPILAAPRRLLADLWAMFLSDLVQSQLCYLLILYK